MPLLKPDELELELRERDALAERIFIRFITMELPDTVNTSEARVAAEQGFKFAEVFLNAKRTLREPPTRLEGEVRHWGDSPDPPRRVNVDPKYG